MNTIHSKLQAPTLATSVNLRLLKKSNQISITSVLSSQQMPPCNVGLNAVEGRSLSMET
jgi:hypothetical protein